MSNQMILNIDALKDEIVYRIHPVIIRGLKTFLIDHGVNLPKSITDLMEDTDISCKAFYFSRYGPLLVMFELRSDAEKGQEDDSKQTKKFLIENLTGDKDIGKLFDLQRTSVRVFRCPKTKGSFEAIKRYAAELSE